MKVLNLQCSHGHGFEGWFGSDDDYQKQSQGGLLECPLCADKAVRRLPSAPRLNLGSSRAPQQTARAERAIERATDQPASRLPERTKDRVAGASAQAIAVATPEQQSVEALWMQAVRHVMANTQDVGARFAEEARRMHYGEAEARGIRGRTTPDEARALDEEGIEVYTLPVPEALKGTSH